MKIGIVLYPTFGGSGVVATELGKALASNGHEVHFITYKQPVKLELIEQNIYFHEVNVSDYPLFDYQPYEFVLTSMLVDVCKYEKLDLLHVHYAIPHASAAYLARSILASQGIHIPIVTTLHGTDITLVGKDAAFEPVITFAINQSDAVTAVSASLREDTYDHFNVTKEIEVIPNFICIDSYPKESDKAIRNRFAPNGEKIMIHISNFRRVKRVEDVVKTYDIVRKEVPTVLLLVGDGPERNRIEKMCRELVDCDKVHLLGKIKETEAILSASDLFVLTSETESFGLAALEAMAARCPVISTGNGGLPEVNIDQETGFVCDVGDVESMAQRSIELLQDEVKFQQFSDRAYDRAMSFEISQIMPLYMRLYEQTIERHGNEH